MWPPMDISWNTKPSQKTYYHVKDQEKYRSEQRFEFMNVPEENFYWYQPYEQVKLKISEWHKAKGSLLLLT